ncbi:MAG: acetyl-CoA C-acetyltransferase [Acidiferrobacterales bacterium]
MPASKVYVIDGARAPFLRAQYHPGAFSAADLAVAAGRPVLARLPLDPSALDEVIIGCVIPAPDETNIARVISLRLGCGAGVPAYTVQRNCASGLQAIAAAREHIACGAADMVLAGGTEAMSRAPVQWNATMVKWLASVMRARSKFARVKAIAGFRPSYLKPVFTLLLGLTDPLVNLSMGQTAEVLAQRFGINREQQDAYALQSHERLAAAYDAGLMDGEVEPLYDTGGNWYAQDTGLRRDSTAERLARLNPVFDRRYGSVTAGNSSQVSDGAAVLVLASEQAVTRYGLPVMGELLDHAWAGVDPRQMGLGPVHAVAKLLQANALTMPDITQMELNEAFAAQVLACQAAWASKHYARDELGMKKPLGSMDPARLNSEGGAIACGHPVGASGARLVLHLTRMLQRKGGGLGVATLCIGGGQGGAMLVRVKGNGA